MQTEQSNISEATKWFVLCTRSRAEKKVAEQLQQHHWEIYLPLSTKYSTWSDRIKQLTVPLIPSIVFVKTTQALLTYLVKEAGSQVRILTYLNKPAVVQEHEIDLLRLICSQPTGYELIKPIDVAQGELVKITKGPFANITATYIQHLGSYKVIVCIAATRTCLQLEVPANAIKKVSENTPNRVSL